mmetsp:Transcript_36222/g.62699  ORF Transcript_36222/g.62699 Transcript_36222/m.62699 type:complete len:242 (+) Transcript_36222:106-831(+)
MSPLPRRISTRCTSSLRAYDWMMMPIMPLEVRSAPLTLKAAGCSLVSQPMSCRAASMPSSTSVGARFEVNWLTFLTCRSDWVRSMRLSATPPHWLIRSNAFRRFGALASAVLPSPSAAASSASPVVSASAMALDASASAAPSSIGFPFSSSAWLTCSSPPPARYHSSSFTCFRFTRTAGSATRILSSRPFTSGENHFGYWKSALWILRKRAVIVGSSKGRKPAKSTYRITPIDQTSAVRPS